MLRRKTPTVFAGKVPLGSAHPVAIQSMTNTPTADVTKTLAQIKHLAQSGSELVRITINDEAAMRATEKIIGTLRAQGDPTPIVGDFHYNGHVLLERYPKAACLLSKYRINPGNVGRGTRQDENFSRIIALAVKYQKPVRIGVNSGSLDTELLATIRKKHHASPKQKISNKILHEAMVESALRSAHAAQKLGLPKNKIVLSVKMSAVPDMIAVYQALARRCDHVLHLGLTEAGGGRPAIISSVSALAVLLTQGIGDTIRISLTPRTGHSRTEEVECCKELLQALGLRSFAPTVISCPGCGRTAHAQLETLSRAIEAYVAQALPRWQKIDPGVNALKIAVMGCIVNGPGESKHADIGLSLPGRGETKQAVVYIDGKLAQTLKGQNLKNEFIPILERYIQTTYR